jgi:hypothetical protein
MIDGTFNELRRALSEMNDGVRALLGPDGGVPELVGELLVDPEPSPGMSRDMAALGKRRRTPPRGARLRSARRDHLERVK